MLKSNQEVIIEFLLLAASLVLKSLSLLDWVILFGVAGGNFLSVDAALEDFDGRRVVGRKFGERHEFLGQMRDERRLNHFDSHKLFRLSFLQRGG